MDKELIYKFYKDCEIDDDEKLEKVIEELKNIHSLEKVESSSSNLIPNEFDLKSNSWQVENEKANGHYEYVSTYDDNKYLFKHKETNRIFLVHKDALHYITSHTKYQDYRFIYIGRYIGMNGNYHSISI